MISSLVNVGGKSHSALGGRSRTMEGSSPSTALHFNKTESKELRATKSQFTGVKAKLELFNPVYHVW